MNTQQKWLAAIAAAIVAFFAVWGINVVIDLPGTGDDDFTLSAEAFTDSVVLSWKDPPDGVEDFMALRSGVGELGTFSKMDSVAPPGNRVVDRNVNAGETWFYVVRARRLDSLTNIVEVNIPEDTLTEPPDTTELPDTTTPPDTSGNVGGPRDWPDNEPAGMTTLVDWRGDRTFDGMPRWRRVWGSDEEFAKRYIVVADPAAKYGHALEKRYFAGDGDGWGDVGDRNNRGPRYLYGNQDHHDEVYMRISYMYDPDWENHPSGGDKMVLSLANGIAPKAYHHGRVPYWPVSFPEFPHGRANQGGYAWLPIVPGSPPITGLSVRELRELGYVPTITFGQYHTVEVWLKRSDPGQINASMRFWFDGVEYTRFYGLGHCDEPSGCDVSFEQFRTDYPDEGESDVLTPHIELPMYWGGQNGLKDEDDYLRLSEVYVSARN